MKHGNDTWLDRVRITLKEVLHATERHFEAICDEDNGRLQDVIDGMDISLQKLRSLLKNELSKPRGRRHIDRQHERVEQVRGQPAQEES